MNTPEAIALLNNFHVGNPNALSWADLERILQSQNLPYLNPSFVPNPIFKEYASLLYSHLTTVAWNHNMFLSWKYQPYFKNLFQEVHNGKVYDIHGMTWLPLERARLWLDGFYRHRDLPGAQCRDCSGYDRTLPKVWVSRDRSFDYVCDVCYRNEKYVSGLVVVDGYLHDSRLLRIESTFISHVWVSSRNVDSIERCRECDRHHLIGESCSCLVARKPKAGIISGYHNTDPVLLGFFPLLKPRVPGTRYFGVEIEVISETDRSIVSAEDLIKLPWVALQTDSSLEPASHGIEIISAPHTYEAICARFLGVGASTWRQALRRCRAHEHECCGMHVHVSKDSLTDRQIDNIAWFIGNPANEAFLDVVSQRMSNKYCIRDRGDHDHYQAFNVHNRDTVEFRMFRSNTRTERILKNLEFVQSLIEYSHVKGKKMHWRSFLRYLSERVEVYPNLSRFLMEHRVSVKSKLETGVLMALSKETHEYVVSETSYMELAA